MPAKKLHRVTIDWLRRSMTIDGKESEQCPTTMILESTQPIVLVEPKTAPVAPCIIRELKAFEEDMRPYETYGVDMGQFYQMLLHADTLRKITLIRMFPGLFREMSSIERIVQLLVTHQLIVPYRGGYRKTTKCMERLRKLHDPTIAAVGSQTQYLEQQRKKETQWMGESALDQWLTTLLANTDINNDEIERELRKMRAEAITKGAPKEQIARLDVEIATYITRQSEVEHVKFQANEIDRANKDAKKRTKSQQEKRIRVAKPSAKDRYSDEEA